MAPREGRIGRRDGALSGWTLAAALALGFGLYGFAAAAPSAAYAQGTSPQAKQTPASPAVAKKKKRASTQPGARAAAQRNAAPGQPRQQQPKGLIETIMQGPRLTTTPPEAADWVRATRPDANAPPRQAARPPGPGRALLTPDEIRAREAQLDALRNRHDRIAGRKPQPGKPGSAAGKPQEGEVAKHKPGCVLTCSTPISVPRTQRR